MLELIQVIFIIWVGYETIPSKETISNESKAQKEVKAKNIRVPTPTEIEECETLYTVKYKTKTSGIIEVCEGRLLEPNEKTKFITKEEK